MLPRFRLHLYARPSQMDGGVLRPIDGCDVLTWTGIDVSTTQLPVSFEQAAEQLERFERLHFEYDGSFVWTGVGSDGNVQTAWQLDGMLYDYAGQLQRVELQGACPMEEWTRLLLVFAPKSDLLLVHWLEEGCFVSPDYLAQKWSAADA